MKTYTPTEKELEEMGFTPWYPWSPKWSIKLWSDYAYLNLFADWFDKKWNLGHWVTIYPQFKQQVIDLIALFTPND